MHIHDDHGHFTRAQLAFAFARADSLTHNIPIIDVQPAKYHLPDIGKPYIPAVPYIDRKDGSGKNEWSGKERALQLQCARREDCPYVYGLIEEHLDLWLRLVNHRFPKEMANGSASFDEFRFYMVQDILYCQGYVRDKMMGASQADFATLEEIAAKLPSSVRYCLDMNDLCVNDLGIPQATIDNTPPSKILLKSREFTSSVARSNDWFGLHIVLLPCILGYYEIAATIIGSPRTERNTLYHTLWTNLNVDVSYANAYIKFVNDNLERFATPEALARWSKLFGEACSTEIDLFDIGKELTDPYVIVPRGCYRIINFRNGWALERPVIFDPSLNDYIPSIGRQPIYTAPISDSDSQKWILQPTMNGYTLRNAVTKEYASVHAAGGKLTVVASEDKAFWWINPMNGKYECPPMKYQFFVSNSVHHALGVSREPSWEMDLKDPNILWPVDGSNQGEIHRDMKKELPWEKPDLKSPALAEMNYRGTSQMWILQEVPQVVLR